MADGPGVGSQAFEAKGKYIRLASSKKTFTNFTVEFGQESRLSKFV